MIPQLIFSQKKLITVDFQNVKIEDALIDIASSNQYEITFNSSYFDGQTISIREHQQPILSILSKILIDTKVDFSIKANKIILTKQKNVFGYMIDKATGERLISATIYDPQSGIGTVTNENGYFNFYIPFESEFLTPSYVGYISSKVDVRKGVKLPLIVEMNSNGRFSEIIVTKDELTKTIEQALGKEDLITNDIKTLYATGGEPDVFQYLYNQPGITTGPDGLGGVHVRGGDVSHNLFLYDGVKVYTPFHSLGLFSIFDINQLKHANFSKYGFHPKHGGRLSSVLDMQAKEGDLHNWNTDLSFSTLATHLGFNGPIKKGKTSISLYGRRTHFDPFFKNRTEKNKQNNFEEGYANHYFYDINAKLYHQFNTKDRLSITFYNGEDSYSDRTDFYYEDPSLISSDSTRYAVNWNNQLAAIKWNHLYNNRLSSNLTFSYTNYEYHSNYQSKYFIIESGFEDEFQNDLIQFYTGINDLGADLDFDFFLNQNHHFSFGVGFHNIYYEPGVGQDSTDSFIIQDFDDSENYFFDDSLENSYVSNEIHFYFNDKWQLQKNLILNIGGRYSNFRASNLIFISDSDYHIFQGSLSLHWLLQKNLSTTLSLDRTSQPVHLLSTSNIGFPNDLWLPSIENVKPSVSHQINIGFDYRYNNQFTINLDGYFKRMNNLVKFSELSSLPSLFEYFSDFWESEVTSGNSDVYGLEVDLKYQTQNFKGSLAYTYSKANRQFEAFNDNQLFPFAFDQRHKVTFNLFQKIKTHLWAYANWNFYNGLNQTFYLSQGPFAPLNSFNPPPDIRLSSINGDQLPNYHRLDIGIVYRKTTNKFNYEIQLGVQNVYNRKNIFFTYQEEDILFPEFNGKRESRALPILPSVMYKVNFSTKK